MRNILKILLREGLEKQTDEKVGKVFWFEYHCDETPSSCDYHLFLRSHQKVMVLQHMDNDNPPDEPQQYKVRFSDGYEDTVWEDELMDSPDEFYRPDPPSKQ
jgi:hypothetical protein